MTRFDRPGSAGRTALVGVLSAGGLAVLWMACLTPSGRTGITAAAGLFPVAAVLLAGRAAGWLCWAVIALLGLLLLPNKAVSLMFALFLGLYPVAKSRLEQLRQRGLEWVLKLLLFNGAMLLTYFVLLRFTTAIDPQEFTIAGVYLPGVVLAFGNVVFCVYDVALTRLVGLYLRVWQPRVRRWLHF